jgi:pentatricopeptide repeat protein
LTNALRAYEQAAANAPQKGSDRALIFREWGVLLRDSGDANATDKAIENFEIALKETPNDVIAKHALAHMLTRKGGFGRVKTLLQPLMEHPSPTTREKTYSMLLEAYARSGDILEAATLKSKYGADLG